MRIVSLATPVAALVSFGLAISCASRDEAAPTKEKVNVFPAETVCTYPANASARKFHSLGVGTWSPDAADESTSRFHCAGAANTVQLFAGADTSINVEYNAAGTALGSTLLTLRYSAIGGAENESAYRSVFANFADDTLKQALLEPMPELMRKKILNLNSYFKSDTVQEETFNMGDGFVNLARERDETTSSVQVTLQIFPDRSLKLN